MKGMASMWLVVSLCKASVNIMVRSWWKTASVAIVKVKIFRVKARLLLFSSCLVWKGMCFVLIGLKILAIWNKPAVHKLCLLDSFG